MKSQTFGIEIEMNHISRGMAAQVIAATLPSNTLGDGAVARYVGGSYDKWEVRGVDGRVWRVVSDASIAGPYEERTEVVSPICKWEDIELVQAIVRALREAGAVAHSSCGIHVHIGLGAHTPKTLRNALLTRVVSDLVNRKARSNAYGISLISIPDFDYAAFLSSLKLKKKAEVFFLGFSNAIEQSISAQKPAEISCSFSIEDAEASRNSGNEDTFRILIIKQAGIEKLSSLRWIPTVTLEKVYIHSCDIVKNELSGTNAVIDALLQALRSKQIRSILSFERVLDYLQLLTEAEPNALPETVRSNFYKLGLLSDSHIVEGKPSREDFIQRIRRNHEIVERISIQTSHTSKQEKARQGKE